MNSTILSFITWDPPKNIFTVPFIDRPIAFYGFFFVLGFILGYFICLKLFKVKLIADQALPETEAKHKSLILTDRLLWYTLIGAIIGARLGHVFFYDWPLYKDHPLDIFKVWEGGLASHGGTIGALIALLLYRRTIAKEFPSFNLVAIMDMITIPTALIACLIRVGNFFNQEILGPQTSVPWAIIFKHPADGSPPVPRHPTQAYEAIAYLALFLFLWTLWKKKGLSLKQGVISGLFFTLLFTARFLIEFVKSPQSLVFDESLLQTGQLLSIPFIILGLALLFYGNRWKVKAT